MRFSKMKMLAGMEFLKLPERMNIVFLLMVLVIITGEVLLAVRLELETADPYALEKSAFDYADRYINNIAITFFPILFLLNTGREFEQGIVHRSLVSGLSRVEYFITRIIQLLIFSVLAVLLAIIFMLITAASYQLPVVWNLEKLSLYFLVTFCLGSMGYVIVLLLKKIFYSLITFACYIMAENIAVMSLSAKKIELVLPATAGMRMLKQGTYLTTESAVIGISTLVLLVLGYFRFLRSDLR